MFAVVSDGGLVGDDGGGFELVLILQVEVLLGQ